LFHWTWWTKSRKPNTSQWGWAMMAHRARNAPTDITNRATLFNTNNLREHRERNNVAKSWCELRAGQRIKRKFYFWPCVCKSRVAIARERERARNAYLWVGRFCLHRAGWVTCARWCPFGVDGRCIAYRRRLGRLHVAGAGPRRPINHLSIARTRKHNTQCCFSSIFIYVAAVAARRILFIPDWSAPSRETRKTHFANLYLWAGAVLAPGALHAILKFIPRSLARYRPLTVMNAMQCCAAWR
jgi:hypothetical protein